MYPAKLAASLVLAFAGLLLLAGSAQCQEAQEPAIEIPRIEFLDAQLRGFGVGEIFKVNVKQADLRSAGGVDKVRLRIFRGSKADLLGPLRYPAPDGCLIYRSGFFRAAEYSGGLRVQSMSRHDVIFTNQWLESRADGSLSDQRFMLILEKEPVAREILKLRQEDAQAYFDTGFEFVVQAPRRPVEPSLGARLFEVHSTAREESGREVARVAHEHPPGQTKCLHFSALTIARSSHLVGAPCGLVAEAGDLERVTALGSLLAPAPR